MASKMYEIAFQLGAKLQSSFGSAFSTAQQNISKTEKGLNKMASVSEKAHTGISTIAKGALGLATSIAGGAGLIEFASTAIQAGNNAYELSQKMHLPAAEATNLSKMLKLSNTDSQPFISTMLKLDKGLESAGKNGNATTKALSQFGVKLTDAHGNLLPMNQQLEQLASAYQKAASNGNEEAFTASVLGAKGAALTGILADYNNIATEAGKTKGIGIDPELAHKVYLETQGLKNQMSQFGLVAGNALLPIISRMIPPLQKGMANLATIIKSNQPQIKKFSDNIIKIGTDIASKVSPIIKQLFDFVANHGNATKAIVLGIGAAFIGFRAISSSIRTFNSVKNVITNVGKAVDLLKKKQILQTIATNASKAATSLWSGVTKAFTAVQAAFNAVLSMNPIALVVITITALVAILVIAFNKNKVFHDFVITSWNAIKVKAFELCEGIKQAFTPIGSFIINVFQGAWNGIKSFINLIINGINAIIGGLNSIKIPKITLPGIGSIGGNGINIPKIPQFANGGYVKHKHGGILANIGEGTEDEIVSPISKLKNIINNTNTQQPTFTYAPQVTIQGNASKDDVYQALAMSQSDFDRMADNYFRNKKRLSFEQ